MVYSENLANEALLEGTEYAKRLLEAIDTLTEMFYSGRENLALEDFPDLIDGLEWLLKLTELTLPTQQANSIEFKSKKEFNNAINEMVSAFEQRDYVLLGDLLTYELKPIIEEWSAQLILITDRLKLA